jgi:hypothetical protein
MCDPPIEISSDPRDIFSLHSMIECRTKFDDFKVSSIENYCHWERISDDEDCLLQEIEIAPSDKRLLSDPMKMIPT